MIEIKRNIFSLAYKAKTHAKKVLHISLPTILTNIVLQSTENIQPSLFMLHIIKINPQFFSDFLKSSFVFETVLFLSNNDFSRIIIAFFIFF